MCSRNSNCIVNVDVYTPFEQALGLQTHTEQDTGDLAINENKRKEVYFRKTACVTMHRQ